MNYFRLSRRVPERSAVEPKALAWLYGLITETPMVRAAHHRFVSGALAQGVAQGLALDLGTGPGYVAVEIARGQPDLRIIGLDLAAHMVGKARRYAAWTRMDGRALWPQADGHRLPFSDASFDLVFSSFALHHWQDPLQVLNEMARVLRPGGRYYVSDVCREPSLVQRLLAYASIPAISLAFGSYRGYGGYYESLRAGYTRAEARDLLARSALPPGEVRLESTWLVPILTMSAQSLSEAVRSNRFSRSRATEVATTNRPPIALQQNSREGA